MPRDKDGGARRVDGTIKGVSQGDLCGSGVVLYLDGSGGYIHLDVIK